MRHFGALLKTRGPGELLPSGASLSTILPNFCDLSKPWWQCSHWLVPGDCVSDRRPTPRQPHRRRSPQSPKRRGGGPLRLLPKARSSWYRCPPSQASGARLAAVALARNCRHCARWSSGPLSPARKPPPGCKLSLVLQRQSRSWCRLCIPQKSPCPQLLRPQLSVGQLQFRLLRTGVMLFDFDR